jgi:hypothetical protein
MGAAEALGTAEAALPAGSGGLASAADALGSGSGIELDVAAGPASGSGSCWDALGVAAGVVVALGGLLALAPASALDRLATGNGAVVAAGAEGAVTPAAVPVLAVLPLRPFGADPGSLGLQPPAEPPKAPSSKHGAYRNLIDILSQIPSIPRRDPPRGATQCPTSAKVVQRKCAAPLQTAGTYTLLQIAVEGVFSPGLASRIRYFWVRKFCPQKLTSC